MKLGSIRRFDSKGRIQVPVEIRSMLGLDDEDLNVYVNESGNVVISKIENKINPCYCSVCGMYIISLPADYTPLMICERCQEKYKKNDDLSFTIESNRGNENVDD